MSVAIIVPVLKRPHNVAPLLAAFKATTPDPYRVLFVCTPGDTNEVAAVRAAGADVVFTERAHPRGDYARKINLGYRSTIEPFLFLGADDLNPHPGWLEAALAQMASGIGVVGTNDLGNPRVMRGQHATHSLVARDYVDEHGTIDEPGKVLHEGYAHEFVDDEFICTARSRDAFAFAADSIVEHMHPHWKKAPTDALYDDAPRRYREGQRLFVRRKRLWTQKQRVARQ
jgi:glycosyltransferase involved in cell wall biosynthesis